MATKNIKHHQAFKNKRFSNQVNINEKQLGTTDTGDNYVIIKGLANAYTDQDGNVVVDRDDEIILPSAYQLDEYMKNPIVLYQHDWDRPIGKTTQINVTDRGLEVEVQVFESMHKEAYAGIVNGVLKAFSVGFMYEEGKWEDPMAEDNYTWIWTKVKLYEISIVSIPANQESLFEVAGEQTPCQGEGTCLVAGGEVNNNKSATKQLNDNTVAKSEGAPEDNTTDEGGEPTNEPTQEQEDNTLSEPTNEPEGNNDDGEGGEPSNAPTKEPEENNEGANDNDEEAPLIDILKDISDKLPDTIEDEDTLTEAYNLYERLVSVINASLE